MEPGTPASAGRVLTTGAPGSPSLQAVLKAETILRFPELLPVGLEQAPSLWSRPGAGGQKGTRPPRGVDKFIVCWEGKSGMIPESCPRVSDAPLSCLSLWDPAGSPWDEVAGGGGRPGGPPRPPKPRLSLCSGIPLGRVTSLPRVGCASDCGKGPERRRKAGRRGCSLARGGRDQHPTRPSKTGQGGGAGRPALDAGAQGIMSGRVGDPEPPAARR